MRTSLRNATLWGSDAVLLVPAVVNPQTSYRDAMTTELRQRNRSAFRCELSVHRITIGGLRIHHGRDEQDRIGAPERGVAQRCTHAAEALFDDRRIAG